MRADQFVLSNGANIAQTAGRRDLWKTQTANAFSLVTLVNDKK